jgi:ADP-ribosylglycohydrolase
MLGAIIGDIVGSRFEFNNSKTYDFELFTSQCDFTDDTICTVAVADAVLGNGSYKDCLHRWCRQFPHPMGSYGGSFARWIASAEPQPYNSYGNGAAMRVSPIGWAFDKSADVLREAIASACVSHDHPEGIKGAQATALAVFTLRSSKGKECVRSIEQLFYDPSAQYERGKFDETCQGTVPVALRIMYDSSSFEDAIRLAMAWGGDSDTLGAIVGAMAEAYYGIPNEIRSAALGYLPADMKAVLDIFYKKYGV